MSDERLEIERQETGAGAASRRAMLVGAGAVGATAVLAACGTDDAYDRYSQPAASDPADSPAAPESPGAPESPAAAEGEGESEEAGLVATADVEVGGGVIVEDEDLVVTQPAEGEWKGFTATCTHQGCTVAEVANGTINCNCHGSQFSVEDGSVVNGPAPAPLEERAVKVDGDFVNLA